MLKGIALVAAVIVGLMVAVKDGRLLRTAGLTGSCAVVQTYQDTSELTACKPGKLEGRPDLSHRGCRSLQLTKGVEYWRCPTGFDISDLGR